MRKLRQKFDVAKILFEVSCAVNASLDLNEVNALVLKESVRALRVDHAALFLTDESSGRPMLTGVQGFSQSQTDNLKLLGSWERINDELIKHKRPLVVNDIKKSSVFRKARLPFSEEELPVRSFLAVPLVKKGALLGTLIVSNTKRPGCVFGAQDKALLATLSNHLAIAISNAKLFDELSRTQAEVAQQEKMAIIGTLSAGINHEIKNPLAIIRGSCELFAIKAAQGTTGDVVVELVNEAKAIMEQVIHQADRATAIATRLANFAKPAKSQTERVTLDKEIDEVLGLVGYELRLAEITVEKQLEANVSDILTDRKQFQEVLFNLIRNAAQAIDKKGTITISARRNEGRLAIDIKDTGSGIPEEKVGKLFSAFFTTKGPGKGTGLGLYIVRKIVEKNGGSIYLKETCVGKGTTFSLEFPVAGM